MSTNLEQLQLLSAQWTNIANGRESYGAGTTVEQATRFQMDQLLVVTSARCRENLDADLRAPVAGLISLVGMSPQTTITLCEALRPRELLLVTSAFAASSVDTISAWLNDASREWAAPNIVVELIAPTDSNAIATSVQRWLETQRSNASAGRIVFDATGGKKSMSVIAGMLAAKLGFEVVYLDSTFDASLKLPRPGSEVIVRIPLPLL